MNKFRALLVGAALLIAGATQASAADLYGRGGSIKDGYAPMPMQSSPHAWYIRGDVAYARYDDPSMLEGGRFNLTGTEIDSQWAAGAGIGYYFSRNVRADITWDYRFEADARGAIPGIGLVNFPGVRNFGLQSNVVLANFYYDFEARGRFTPYIGFGIGMANNKTTTGSVPDGCACGFTNVTVAGASQWSVAGALMTGFSMNIRDRLHLDAGYRMMYLGEAQTGLISGTTVAPAPAVDGHVDVSDLLAHEFRVGLRYDIR